MVWWSISKWRAPHVDQPIVLYISNKILSINQELRQNIQHLPIWQFMHNHTEEVKRLFMCHRNNFLRHPVLFKISQIRSEFVDLKWWNMLSSDWWYFGIFGLSYFRYFISAYLLKFLSETHKIAVYEVYKTFQRTII